MLFLVSLGIKTTKLKLPKWFEFLHRIVPVTPVMFFLAPSILHLGFVEITHPNNSWYKKRYQAGFPVSKTAAINVQYIALQITTLSDTCIAVRQNLPLAGRSYPTATYQIHLKSCSKSTNQVSEYFIFITRIVTPTKYRGEKITVRAVSEPKNLGIDAQLEKWMAGN